MTRIALIVLAAGSSERFGVLDKLATPVAGRPLLAWTLELGATEHVARRDRLVVVGPGSAIATRLGEAHGWRTVFAHDAPRGMGASLRAGIEAIATDADVAGVVVALADDPLAMRMLPAVLAAALAAPDSAPVAVRRTPFLPHPVYLPRASWPQPGARLADHGLREELDGVDTVWLDDRGPHPVDVDTHDDIGRLLAAMSVD